MRLRRSGGAARAHGRSSLMRFISPLNVNTSYRCITRRYRFTLPNSIGTVVRGDEWVGDNHPGGFVSGFECDPQFHSYCWGKKNISPHGSQVFLSKLATQLAVFCSLLSCVDPACELPTIDCLFRKLFLSPQADVSFVDSDINSFESFAHNVKKASANYPDFFMVGRRHIGHRHNLVVEEEEGRLLEARAEALP